MISIIITRHSRIRYSSSRVRAEALSMSMGPYPASTRLELYRMRLCLVMTIEITPRKFEGDWVEPHRAAVTANLHAALAALA